MVQSPCVKICELNAQGVCIGCGRDRAEIGDWTQMSDAQKRETNQRAAARLKTLRAGADVDAPASAST